MRKNTKFIGAVDSSLDGPSLIVKVKQVRDKLYEVSIIHPNTSKILYKEKHHSPTYNEALASGKMIRDTRFSLTKTYHEDKIFITSPKRGKMALNVKKEEKRKTSKKTKSKAK